MSTKAAYALKTTPAHLVTWAKTPFARKQTRTAAALATLALGDQRSLHRAHAALGAIVAAPVRSSVKFGRDPSAALALVILDRAIGRTPMPEIDAQVDAAFAQHGGDLVKLAAERLDELADFSKILWRIHDRLPLSEAEEMFSRRAVEDAQYEMHDTFVSRCVEAAEYLGEDLIVDEPQLADRALYAWLLHAFPTALPTFETGERARLLLALAQAAPVQDLKEVETFVQRVIRGDCVNALDYQVVRTRHLPLLRAFVAEAPEGLELKSRALLPALEKHGPHRWSAGGKS